MRNALAIAAILMAAACGSSKPPATETENHETTDDTETGTGDDTTPPADHTDQVEQKKPVEPPPPPKEVTSRHLRPADIKWMPFDASKPDQGPWVAQIWGDPGTGPAGLMVKADPKFASPPHVHTSDYRAVVISGSVTNDVPKPKKKPAKLGVGSYWQQAGGEVHVTACPDGCIGYLTIEGAFDNLTPDKAGKSPTGMKSSNIPAAKLKWVAPPGTQGIWFAQAWGDPNGDKPHGFFIKIAAGNPGFMHYHTNDYHAVVIQGSPRHWEPGETAEPSPPGSYFWQKGGAPHQDSCDAGTDCIGYVVMLGKLDFFPAK
ncbi:MAG TPA: DUF4437 domain-containing protein [Kofleriaceae bacterium]|nr:DUF4437 domain-containing protein [Kofleriaceae bacterium]